MGTTKIVSPAKSERAVRVEALKKQFEADDAEYVTNALPCDLTHEERLEFGDKLSEHEQLHEHFSEKKKAEAKKLAEVIGGHKAEIRRISQCLKSKTVERAVDCIELYVDKSNEVVVVRLDTEKVVARRAMTAEERQKPLPLPSSPQMDLDGAALA